MAKKHFGRLLTLAAVVGAANPIGKALIGGFIIIPTFVHFV